MWLNMVQIADICVKRGMKKELWMRNGFESFFLSAFNRCDFVCVFEAEEFNALRVSALRGNVSR